MRQPTCRPLSVSLWIALLCLAAPAHSASLSRVAEWGERGSGPGQLDTPTAIAVSGATVLVADFENGRIQRFSSDGEPLASWDDAGSGPVGLAVDRAGNVFVADRYRHEVRKLSPAGALLARWGSHGRAPGQFDHPHGIALDASGNLYVSDLGNHRIQKLSASGEPLAAWGTHGSGPGQLDEPWGIAIDAHGNVFVADHGNHRIQRFTSDGRFVAAWGGPDVLEAPAGLAVRASGALYVSDRQGRRLQKLGGNGELLAAWEEPAGKSALGFPHRSIAIGEGEALFVADAEGHRVERLVDPSSDHAPSLARIPESFSLISLRPNPSQGPSTLLFGAPRRGDLTVGVFDVTGRRVRQLAHGLVEPGEHLLTWDGRGENGDPVPAGVYLVRAAFGDDAERSTLNRRIVMLK